MWKHVSCPYVLKFNGVFYHNDVPAIVTPWMAHGNITEYLEKHPDANRLCLVSPNVSQRQASTHSAYFRYLACRRGQRYQVPSRLRRCARGHQSGESSHSYERSCRNSSSCQPNILISDSDMPRATLADFGFTRVMTISVKESSEEQGTASFMAPELLLSEKFGLKKGVPSKEADIYALGMTVYQVLTGKWPFYPKREAEVMHAVIAGERPPKPENAEEIGIVWDLLEECWREDRTKRPNISEILGRFCEITGERKSTDSTVDVAGTRPNTTGNRNSVVSQDSSSTNLSCEQPRLCPLFKPHRHLLTDEIDVVHYFSFTLFGYGRGVFNVCRNRSLVLVRFPRSGGDIRSQGETPNQG